MTKWKTIPEFSRYEVSRSGEVRNRSTQRILKIQFKSRGEAKRRSTYRTATVGVCHDTDAGKNRHLRVGRAVLKAFGPPMPPDKPLALHWDDDPANNDISNLRWGDMADNTADAIRNGLIGTKISPEETATARHLLKIGHSQNAIGKILGRHHSAMVKILKG